MTALLARISPAAAAVAAAGLLLTACGGSPGSGSGAGASGSAATGSAGASAAAGGSGGTASGTGGSAAGSGGSSGGSGGGGSTGSAAGGGSTATCTTGDLAFSWLSGDRPAPGGGAGQKTAVVGLRNTSGHPCAMHGYPGVDLVDSGTQWPLARESAPVGTVVLANGRSARFTITYLSVASTDPGAFRVTTTVITPPNQRSSYDLPWKWGAVLLQDGATRPGTYVGPVHG